MNVLRSSVTGVLVILVGGLVLLYGLAEAKQAGEMLNVTLVIGIVTLVGGTLSLGMSVSGDGKR